MASPKGEPVKPLLRNGRCDQGHRDGHHSGDEEEQRAIVEIVEVVHKTLHQRGSEVRQVWSTWRQEEAELEAEPEHPKGKSDHQTPECSGLVGAGPEDAK